MFMPFYIFEKVKKATNEIDWSALKIYLLA